MKYVPYKFSRLSLLVPFTFAAFLLLIFQPMTRTIADSDKQPVVATREFTVETNQLPKRPPVKFKIEKESKVGKVLSQLSTLGPLIPEAYSLSNFAIQGLFKGNIPVSIIYELEADSSAEVLISTADGKAKFPISLQSTNGERVEVKKFLPETFGQKLQVGSVSFRALKNGPEPRKPADFFLYFLGVGRQAVHSAVIVDLQFRPGTIRPKLKGKASYSFRSLSDFNKAAAEVRVLTRAADGSSYPLLVYKKEFKDGVRVGETREGEWDGKNSKGKVSIGTHQFHVRAWRGFEKGGDWATVSEKLQVKVEQ